MKIDFEFNQKQWSEDLDWVKTERVEQGWLLSFEAAFCWIAIKD